MPCAEDARIPRADVATLAGGIGRPILEDNFPDQAERDQQRTEDEVGDDTGAN
jgi:hypothetical protein